MRMMRMILKTETTRRTVSNSSFGSLGCQNS
jgi:hypothetical protein